MKKIYFTVNNDLNYDQRMARICGSLALHNYNVVLVGKEFASSAPIVPKSFLQHRIPCVFKKGKSAYIEFNIKLFFYLLCHRADCLCAIDLDTICPVLLVSRIKNCRRVYDAHELFTEMKEIVTRPAVQKLWNWAAKNTIPHFKMGYTVSESIAQALQNRYSVQYQVVRNMPRLIQQSRLKKHGEKFILYQGAVNQGRALEHLIPSMKHVAARLIICGDGNFMQESLDLVAKHQLTDKIIFKGMLLPQELINITGTAYIGINLVEPQGLNQLYSLANKFFDYMHAGIPQVTMNFIEYARINDLYQVAVLIPEPKPALIAAALNLLLDNNVLYRELEKNCAQAREVFNWQMEEQKLLAFYRKVFAVG